MGFFGLKINHLATLQRRGIVKSFVGSSPVFLAVRIFGVERLFPFVDEAEAGFGLTPLQGLDADHVPDAGETGNADVAGLAAKPPFPGRPEL
jgi:hypothetical protein